MKKVMVFNYDGTTLTFNSINDAARHYNVEPAYIRSYIKKGCGSYKLQFTKIFVID